MKNYLYALVLALSATGCAAHRSAIDVKWASLHSDPKKYDGRRVRMCGWFQAQRELCSFSPTSTTWGVGGRIWIHPKGDWCRMDQVIKRPFEGSAIIEGVIHWGETYGHFGEWDFAMDQAIVSTEIDHCD